MKIGIITFNSAHNYGAVLQTFALQEYLRMEGHQVEIINYRIPEIDNLYRLFKPTKPYKNKYMNKYFHVRQKLYVRVKQSQKHRKFKKFEHFINHTLNTTEPIRNYRQLLRSDFHYDVLIAGSDQIWNGAFTRGVNPGYVLGFGKDEVKRITYAASIGRNEIPEVEHTFFQRYLKEIDYISVREENAREQIMPLTDKEVKVVLDPTLLLDREKYDKLKKDPHVNEDYIYVHNVHLTKVDERLNAMVEELSKRTGLPVVHNRSDYSFSNQLKKQFTDGGPEEFLGWIANAKYVVANSFHATVFSMIYHREFITVPHFQNPERMRFFLDSLGMVDHLIGEVEKLPKDLDSLKIDYEEVEKKRMALRQESMDFLKEAIDGEKTNKKPVTWDQLYFDSKDIYSCYGCHGCENICPTDAITMEVDQEGFWYPNINEDKCIHCNKCRKVCIYHKSEQYNKETQQFPLVYAAYHKTEKIQKESTSGGMFTPMYQYMLNQGGKVVGVKYNDNMEVVYDIADTESGCEAFRGSKYVAADSNDVKKRVKKLLDAGEKVLFTGNPCQISAVRSYLGKDYENLYLVELICHGVPSPKVFKKYLEYLEDAYHSKVVKFSFRNKFKGWEKPYICVEFESGELLLEEASRNNFNRAFLSNYIQRPVCYTCEFADMKGGFADITIGDFWGVKEQLPEMFHEQGTSVIKINNEKGLELFQNIKDQYQVEETTYDKAYASNHKKPMRLTMNRNFLMSQIDEEEIDSLLQSYNHLKKKKRRK